MEKFEKFALVARPDADALLDNVDYHPKGTTGKPCTVGNSMRFSSKRVDRVNPISKFPLACELIHSVISRRRCYQRSIRRHAGLIGNRERGEIGDSRTGGKPPSRVEFSLLETVEIVDDRANFVSAERNPSHGDVRLACLP